MKKKLTILLCIFFLCAHISADEYFSRNKLMAQIIIPVVGMEAERINQVGIELHYQFMPIKHFSLSLPVTAYVGAEFDLTFSAGLYWYWYIKEDPRPYFFAAVYPVSDISISTLLQKEPYVWNTEFVLGIPLTAPHHFYAEITYRWKICDVTNAVFTAYPRAALALGARW